MIPHINLKKFVLLGLSVIITIVIYRLLIRQAGAGYPELVSSESNHASVAELFNNVRFVDIDAVVPYEGFTRDERFSLDQRPEHSVALELLELERDNIGSVIMEALRQGQVVMGGAVGEQHFQYGITRHLPGVGEEYTLVFRTGADVFTARVYRPLKESLVTVSRHELLHEHPLHIVMPLSGRLERLQRFLDRLGPIIDSGDSVRLTVVEFEEGENGTASARTLLRRWRHTERTQLVVVPGAFSRGRALLRGANAVVSKSAAGDPLLFFCDVDMEFSALELERCRVHATRGKSVYYPIVFSQYNPRLREALRQTARWPPEPPVSADAGHWRHYGFGMSCQFRSDFLAVSGSFLDVSGWGGEDVALYKRFLQRMRVVRAFDDGLVHSFHAKECSEQLAAAQYRSCVASKITNEGNKLQLGLLALSNIGDIGPKGYGLFYLPWYHRPGGWVTLAMAVLLALSVALNVRLYRQSR